MRFPVSKILNLLAAGMDPNEIIQDYPYLEKALPQVIACLKFPKSHRKKISSSNLIERLFGEGKRRTKVIPRFPTEKSCLTLFYATLIDSSKRWYGVRMSVEIMQELDKLWKKVMPEKEKGVSSKVVKEELVAA